MYFRERFTPAHCKVIFVLESPPKSGKYFYNPEGRTTEPLFSGMMKDVLGMRPQTKTEGLSEFAARGYLVIDATYKPVNRAHLSPKSRDALILEDLPLLVEDLRRYVNDETELVLVKANVCRLLESKLAAAGFTVLNRGLIVHFPSTGRQRQFRRTVRQVLGLESQ